MRHTWYLAVLGAMLLGTLLCVHNTSHASAASIVTTIPALQNTFTHARIQHYPPTPFEQGYLDGYNDCGNLRPSANPYWRGATYIGGYNQGYNFCQSKRAEGSMQGNIDGYNAGYRQCQQEHSNPIITGSAPITGFLPPSVQGQNAAFGPAFQQGYNACQQQYGGQ